ncbi:TonB-dependent receptor plug domain-containing protein [Undibacterium umbellatum]|uniref:TonB-dependent receptor n=1 Tax=Undibacterium umbellatum TaxID=2762300 RepID=A0ABR6ZII0_9BURK|nr:TonB-dependent receptor [Undibacterium umbellatum]MBC3911057.1 TonB-dependent receptor [Undibacterium umbellatum]
MLFQQTSTRLSTIALSILTLFASKAATAQQTPQQVEISAKSQPNRDRQDDVSMRVVYGHEDIEKYGDTNVSEVLKRLPGISVTENKGRGAEIRMRGLGNGYTQILLNGQATPVGFSIDSIAPDLIESIEVMRVAGADVSAQSIAGTINIILKKKSSKQGSEMKSNASMQDGRLSGNLSWSMGDQLPGTQADISYVLAGTLESNSTEINAIQNESYSTRANTNTAWQVQTDRLLQQSQQNRRDVASLSPRLNWKIDAQDSINWQGNLNLTRLEQAKHEKENPGPYASTEFPDNHSIWAAHILTSRNDISWERRLADSAKLNMNFGWNSFDRSAKFQFWGKDKTGALAVHRYVTGDADESEYRFNGKYLAPYSESHVLSLGWEASRALRHENRDELEFFTSSGPTPSDTHAYQASLQKLAVYIQDEWTINSAWSAYLGLRMERINSNSKEAGAFDFQNKSNMLSPILQSVWKLDAQRQWRMALNRSFKLPTVANLVPRRFRIDNNNTPLNADFQGNPNLRPERAWGLELAYEHYLTEGSVISANAYWRRIDDVMLEQLQQNGKSWVASLSNNGRARIVGLEIEAKANLQELGSKLAIEMPAIEIHGNLNRNWSTVEQVPGPDNHLAHQTGLLINVGADYQLQPAWRIGADYNYQAADSLRESAYLTGHSNPRRHLDIYLSWKQSKQSQLRFSIANVLQQDKVEYGSYTDESSRWTEAGQQQTARTWRLVWELKL